MIVSYGKVHTLGTHRDIQTILDGPVTVEEKIDGSQFSFKLGHDGVLYFYSRSRQIDPTAPQMFGVGLAAVKARADKLRPGLTYRGEFLQRERHNILQYQRVPRGHVIIWEVEDSSGFRFSAAERDKCAAEVDLESVPVFYQGPLTSLDPVHLLFNTATSVLGGPIEGVVIKRDGMTAKVVSPAFCETRKIPIPRGTDADFFQALGRRSSTPARWAKAVSRMREDGRLKGTVADIGPLVREVQADVFAECEAEIAAALLENARKRIAQGAVEGLPEWYKGELGK